MTFSGPARTAGRCLASSAPGVPAARHTALHRRLLAALALIALIGAGCANAPAETGSSGGENPATSSSPSTGADSTAAAGTGGVGDQNASAEDGPMPRENSGEFVKCMRENGVEDFPDPNDDGIIKYYGDPDPAEFTSAQENCRHLRPQPEGPNLGNGG